MDRWQWWGEAFTVLALIGIVVTACSRAAGGAARGEAAKGSGTPDEEPSGTGKTPEDGPSGSAGSRPANRLIHEKSPYLLQHAHNPVDWYPWGEEAFAAAREKDRPIFLSIGYSTCHWCHVMERESFEDPTVAEFLRRHFIAIKVDREERPDVDAVYMAAVRSFGRSGGWPLSAFLTPDRKPFFVATYFPRADFLFLLRRVAKAWETERSKLEEVASSVARDLASRRRASGGEDIEPEVARRAAEWFRSAFDPVHGGFGRAPKFPRPSVCDFLLRRARRSGDDGLLDLVRTTLDHMLRGGIRDHLAGGFHRYSTDREWLVPHFEKMLYDNALIARTLATAARRLDRPEYLAVARETMDWVLERLRAPEGVFFCALDADTEGEEGGTYVWTRREILDVLGPESGETFCRYYGVGEKGNFEGGPRSVLHVALAGGLPELARSLDLPLETVRGDLARSRRKLLAVRRRRPQPFLDDKVLAAWNGMTISALSRVAAATGERRYVEAAGAAARFTLERMVVDGRLQRRYRKGETAIPAFLDDHAFVVEGLLDLAEVDSDPAWLESAARLGHDLVRLFQDPRSGVFYPTSGEHEKLIARRPDFYDGAVPSGNSVAFAVLSRLELLTSDPVFTRAARAFRAAAAGVVKSSPWAYPRLLEAAEFRWADPLEVVLVGVRGVGRGDSMLAAVHRADPPARVILLASSDADAKRRASALPLLEGRGVTGGKPTAYLCRGGVCRLPATDVATLERQLAGWGSRPGGTTGAKEGGGGER